MGPSCFINIGLQLAAHFPFYLDLFDSELNPIIKSSSESDENYKNRKAVQDLGKKMIEAILSPTKSTVEGVDHFLRAIEKCNVIQGGTAENLLSTGGDVAKLLEWIVKVLKPDENPDRLPRLTPGFEQCRQAPAHLQPEIREKVESQLKQQYENRIKQVCENPYFRLFDDKSVNNYAPPLTLTVNEYEFILEAVVEGSEGHAYPLIRANHEFIEYNDLKNSPIHHSQERMKDWFKNHPWVSVYYVNRGKKVGSPVA